MKQTFLALVCLLSACQAPRSALPANRPALAAGIKAWRAADAIAEDPRWRSLADRARSNLEGRTASRFSEFHPDTLRRLDSPDFSVALTYDACGGPGGSGFNEKLVGYLETNRVPATLFISWRWITNGNESNFARLLTNRLFEIENHGLTHRPAAVSPRVVYHTASTESLAALIEEIAGNAALLEKACGVRTRFYRSGTAYYDDVAMEAARILEHRVAGWDALSGDVGAGQSGEAIARRVLRQATNGSVVIMHMNQPAWHAAEATRLVVEKLRARGARFVRLDKVSAGL